jgi:EAL domain-containing protein (putative c-di-GMP-specific phosphodiesterase class I)
VSNSASRRRADRTALLPAGRSTLNNLRALRDEGAGIALDDFCTGYASLRYLATLRMTSIKIDKSFTAGLPDHEISRRSFVP